MTWVQLHKTAECAHCGTRTSSSGADPAGKPCHRCGSIMVRYECSHGEESLRLMRPTRANPDQERAQCSVVECSTIFVRQ